MEKVMTTKEESMLLRRQLQRAKALDPIHLNCRVGGDRHHWHLAQPDWDSGTTAIEKCSQCSLCLCIKREEITPRMGEIIKRNYEHPEGYLLKREEGDGPDKLMSSAAVRLATLANAEILPPLVRP